MNATTCEYADPHLHPNPVKGIGGEKLAEQLSKRNVWLLGFVSLPPWDYGLNPTLDNYVKVIEFIKKECENARKKGITTLCFSGFHPAEVDALIDRYHMKPLDVLDLAFQVLDLIEDQCKKGEITGIGEVGHQHYKTFPDRALISHFILEKAFEISKDYSCPIQMHLENNEQSTVRIIDKTISKIMGKGSRSIIFHHSTPSMALEAYELGYSSTIPGNKRPLLEYLFKNLKPVYMLESDFVDDEKRPVKKYPWLMIELESQLLEEGIVDYEYLCKINVDLPREVFHL